MANIKLTELTELLSASPANTILYAADLSVSPNVSHYIRVGSISSLSDYTTANLAYARANTAFSTGFYANLALVISNSSFSKANIAHTQANVSTVTATASFTAANTASTNANLGYNRANAAFVHANSAYNLANSTTSNITASFNRANAAFVHANSAYNLANTINTTSISTLAQSAFNRANNSVLKTGDSITGIVTSPTAANGTSNTMLATTAFVNNTITNVPNNSIGYGQTWQNMASVRASGSTYTNATGKPIMVVISATRVNSSSSVTVVVGGVTIFAPDGTGVWYGSFEHSFIVPPGTTYTVSFGNCLIRSWAELR